jgi:ubiquinone/menaquinone biosynthesis C-methylase UbiE
VLCSVVDQKRALGEVARVLKPGGKFLFIEHVAARRGSCGTQ